MSFHKTLFAEIRGCEFGPAGCGLLSPQRGDPRTQARPLPLTTVHGGVVSVGRSPWAFPGGRAKQVIDVTEDHENKIRQRQVHLLIRSLEKKCQAHPKIIFYNALEFSRVINGNLIR